MRPLHLGISSFFATSVVCLLVALVGERDSVADEGAILPPPTQAILQAPEPAPEAGEAWVARPIRKGDALGSILQGWGLPTTEIRQAAVEFHDLAKIRAGEELAFRMQPGASAPDAVRYQLDEDRTLLVEQTPAGWSAQVDEVVYTRSRVGRAFEVESSLWADAVDAGLAPRDIAAMARVLQYDLDFNTEVQAGAKARLLVDELSVDGEVVKLGSPDVVIFENAGKEYVAVRFARADGSSGYFDREGNARKKAFLRSPLEFGRVTSRYSNRRFHPIKKTWRAHRGVDLGASTGTPVRAVGDGVVTSAGWNGGHGKWVKLDHPGAYDSSYSHLSRIAVKSGAKVKQGQVIGYVGATGAATGPHLHYQFWVNGRYVDPMKVKLPQSERLTGAELAAFKSTRDRLLGDLEAGPSPDMGVAVADGDAMDPPTDPDLR